MLLQYIAENQKASRCIPRKSLCVREERCHALGLTATLAITRELPSGATERSSPGPQPPLTDTAISQLYCFEELYLSVSFSGSKP